MSRAPIITVAALSFLLGLGLSIAVALSQRTGS